MRRLCAQRWYAESVVGNFSALWLIFSIFPALSWPSSRCQIWANLVFTENLWRLLSNVTNLVSFWVLVEKLRARNKGYQSDFFIGSPFSGVDSGLGDSGMLLTSWDNQLLGKLIIFEIILFTHMVLKYSFSLKLNNCCKIRCLQLHLISLDYWHHSPNCSWPLSRLILHIISQCSLSTVLIHHFTFLFAFNGFNFAMLKDSKFEAKLFK